MKKDIILFGIQGSGKGTQADLLMKKLEGYLYFEPGQIFRALKSNDNILGEHIRDRMDKGQMVDDAITFGVFDVYQHLLKPGNYMLIDGFLRTLEQMYYFLTQEHKHKRDFVGIHYNLDKEEAIKRLYNRAKLEGRKDDTEKSISTRLDIYEKETKPVIEYLDGLGKIIHINAHQSIEDIYKETVESLKSHGLLQ
ncbi:MAG: nucleoside monophosphate kinase [Candidatus Absconditabacteria bacterium]|nr:nucleoside monophosphate kinase [Candidatus Absconditabacteria bacterium]